MSNQVQLAVVGFGLIGRRHADVIRRTPGMTLSAVVEPSPEGQDAARAFGAKVYASLEDMMSMSPPDGVVLATPTPLHLEQGLSCISSGCPLLIEKPISVTSEEARQLTDAADRAGVPLLVGHHRRQINLTSRLQRDLLHWPER